MKGITSWVPGWKRGGWKRKGPKKTIDNLDLWKRLDALVQQRLFASLTWTHVSAHSGIRGNECADTLAKAGAGMHGTRALRK